MSEPQVTRQTAGLAVRPGRGAMTLPRVVLMALLTGAALLSSVASASAARLVAGVGELGPGTEAPAAEQGQQQKSEPEYPLDTVAPAITGTAQEGVALTAEAGTWSGRAPITFRYQWLRCNGAGNGCKDVGGQTGEDTYTPVREDVAHTLRVIVTATNSAGTATATSAKSATVEQRKPVNIALPEISGTPYVGQVLSVSEGSWEGTAPLSYSYEWQSCNEAGSNCREIGGGNASSYRVPNSQQGNTLRVVVSASNPAGSASATSAASATVQAGGGGAVAWGENYYGGLGQIYRDTREEKAIGIPELDDIVSVSDANSVTLALLGNGELASWGANAHGQLGDNGFKANWERGQSHAVVDELSGGSAVPLKGATEAAAANQHALVRIGSGPDSTVDAWGNNQYGTLGNGKGTFEVARVPRPVAGISGVRSIAMGGESDFVVLESGEVEAWGGNTSGQLSVEGWPADCYKASTCLADHQPEYEKEEFEFLCHTETGPELCSTKPQFVVDAQGRPIEHVEEVAAGYHAAYALLESGEVLSWGENRRGELGQKGTEVGNHTAFEPPEKVTTANGVPLKDVVEITAGVDHALARRSNGEVLGWGDNAKGELGRTRGNSEICVPTAEIPCFETARPLAGLQPSELSPASVEALAAGGAFSLALVNHRVYAFGKNGDGELGDGSWRGPESCLTNHEIERFHGKAVRDEEEARVARTKKPRERTRIERALKAQLKWLESEQEHAAPCSRAPTAVKSEGAPVEHVRAIAAAKTHAIALLKAGATVPSSPLSASSHLAMPGPHPVMSFKWAPSSVQRVDFRPFERPGEDEAEGEPTGNGCAETGGEPQTGEEGCEEGEGNEGSGPPVNTMLPHVVHVRESLSQGERRTEFLLGQPLEVNDGHWTGEEALEFLFQWERCTAYTDTCTAIPGATEQTYLPVLRDVGDALRVTVTASGGSGSSSVSATSAQTPLIKLTKGRSNSDMISLTRGERESPEWSVSAFRERPREAGQPLQTGTQYEFKFSDGEKNLATVVTAGE